MASRAARAPSDRHTLRRLCRYNRSGPPRNMALQWKQRLHQCVGLPELRRANHTHPNVVVINRPLAHGRGFVNMPAIARRLRVRRLAGLFTGGRRPWAVPWGALSLPRAHAQPGAAARTPVCARSMHAAR